MMGISTEAAACKSGAAMVDVGLIIIIVVKATAQVLFVKYYVTYSILMLPEESGIVGQLPS